ncbi:Mob1/phocein, partial [Gamsiella multidivaricata]|uniref:Mob1/phocein n=1 Tax=Gamsiella multidivaricata TaxID=101098 RepID=UPI00221E8D8E
WPQRPLESIESAFALREYLQALIRHDPHNVDQLIALPAGQDEHSWLYEHLCQICLELNYLIVHLEPECTPEVCPEMRAEEWKYYCATHPTPRECCAIDYLTHTLDGASALLNNIKFFPSRICVPEGSVKNFQSIARRLYRIFAHAYFHHRDIFDAFEVSQRGDVTDVLLPFACSNNINRAYFFFFFFFFSSINRPRPLFTSDS